MADKRTVVKECERMNMARNVCDGYMDHVEFFSGIHGDLLLSGKNACDYRLAADLIKNFVDRQDMSTILLTSQGRILEMLVREQQTGKIQGIVVSKYGRENFYPMYGMSHQQIIHLVRTAAETTECSEQIDGMLEYLSVILDMISYRNPVCLQAILEMLKSSDEGMVNRAIADGMPKEKAGVIRRKKEEGIMLRKVMEIIEDTFSDVAAPLSDAYYNFITGVQEGIPLMAFYQQADDQKIMNTYIKEEIHAILKKVPRVRIILHSAVFTGDAHGLLEYLMQLKKKEQVELIVCSTNAIETFGGTPMEFRNICIWDHDDPAVTKKILDTVYGRYIHHEPKLVKGKLPAFFYRLKKNAEWTVTTGNRLRVRPEDLQKYNEDFVKTQELVAVKMAKNIKVHLVPAAEFSGKKQ